MCCFCSIYTVHDEVKDKAFVLDLSWVGECELISDICCGVCQLQSHFLGRFYLHCLLFKMPFVMWYETELRQLRHIVCCLGLWCFDAMVLVE